MFKYKDISIFTTTKKHGSIKNFPNHKEKPSILPEYILKTTKLPRENIIEVHQIHSHNIHAVNSKNLPQTPTKIKDCDGLLTSCKNTSLLIKTADCIPFAIFNKNASSIGAVHAGWRGLVSKIHEESINQFTKESKTPTKDIKIYIGPSIRSCCYKFSDKPSQANDPDWKPYITQGDKHWQIDLVNYLKSELEKMGIKSQNIIDSKECTYCQKEKYYSHLRHKYTGEPSGTMATVVQLK